MSDPICTCGHYKSIHVFAEYSDANSCIDYKYSTGYCTCNGYKLDNLRYLEMEDAERSKD